MARKKIKKRDLRKCSICQKVGHNKNTCPRLKIDIGRSKPATQKTTSNTVKFFIHHTDSNDSVSPHLMNLKQTKETLWDKVSTDKPVASKSPLYHFYHEFQKTTETKIKAEPNLDLMANLNTVNFAKPKKNLFKNLFAKKIKLPLPALEETTKTQPLQIQNVKNNEETLPSLNIKVFPKKKNYTFDLKLDYLKSLGNKIISAPSNFKLNNLNPFTSTSLGLEFNFKKFAFTTIILILILVAPLQAHNEYVKIKTNTAKVAETGTQGFMSLQESTVALMKSDFNQAQTSLDKALKNFNTATEIMNNNHQFLQKLVLVVPILNNEVKSRQKILTAGQEISLGNSFLLSALKDVNPSSTFSKKIETINGYLDSALPHYKQALSDFNEVKTQNLPTEYQQTFNEYRALFSSLVNDFSNLNDLGKSLPEIFGGKGMRRYLVVFQNEDELRPTGGFIGSFAVIDVKDGKIQNITVPPGGSYDLQGQLTEFVEPPSPLLISNKRWEFQDSNWFPNFEDSAQKMLWFFNKSRQITADGVIAVNSSVLTRLLAVMGPIKDDTRDLTLNTENAITTIQNTVESTDAKNSKKPKQIITDLTPKFLEYFKNIDTAEAMPLLISLNEALQQKEIQVYFTDENSEQKAKEFGWAGQVLNTKNNQDYLMVINTNIQGQKSDAKIKQQIYHEALVQDDGTIIDNVIVKREHTGTSNVKLYDQTNIDYIRIYVPAGSQLLSAEGFTWPDEKFFRTPESWYKKDTDLARIESAETIDGQSGTRITSEFDKTAFGNWMITEPGQTTVAKFSYRLPFKLNSVNKKEGLNKILFSSEEQSLAYQLVLQKQSGNNTSFESQLILPKNWQPMWSDGNDMTLALNGAKIKIENLKNDEIFSLLAKSIR